MWFLPAEGRLWWGQALDLGLGCVSQTDVARAWQILPTTALDLNFRALFLSVETPYLNILFGKTEYRLHGSHFSSTCYKSKQQQQKQRFLT